MSFEYERIRTIFLFRVRTSYICVIQIIIFFRSSRYEPQKVLNGKDWPKNLEI